MPIQILPPDPSLSSTLGELLGSGAAMGTGLLMQQMQRKRKADALRAAGLPAEYVDLDPRIIQQQLKIQEQQKAAQNFGRLLAGSGQQPTQQRQGMGEVLDGLNPEQQQPSMQQRPSREQILAHAAQSGLNQQQLAMLDRSLYQQAKQSLAERKFEFDQNKPLRKIEMEEANSLSKSLPALQRQLHTYNGIIKTAESGKLRAGLSSQFLDKLGLKDVGRNMTTEVADKLINDVINQELVQQSQSGAGSATDERFRSIVRGNPSLLLTPEGIKNTAKLKALGVEQQMQTALEMRKIQEKYKGKGLPVGALEEARRAAQPKIDELFKEQDKLIDNIASQDMPKITIGARFESLPANSPEGTEAINKSTGEMRKVINGKWVTIKKGR